MEARNYWNMILNLWKNETAISGIHGTGKKLKINMQSYQNKGYILPHLHTFTDSKHEGCDDTASQFKMHLVSIT